MTGNQKEFHIQIGKSGLKLLLIATGAILAVVLIYLMIIKLSQLPQTKHEKQMKICGYKTGQKIKYTTRRIDKLFGNH